MTDNEIIKALECCTTYEDGCSDACPLRYTDDTSCFSALIKPVFDLINRQKAEIERLSAKSFEHNITKLFDKYKAHIKVEAVKEFAERLKENKIDIDVSFGYGREVYTEAVAVIEIDNLVKEMVGAESG